MENTTHPHLTTLEDPHEPNIFHVHAEGNWLLKIQHNGEQLVEKQRENTQRLAACWNACMGVSTQWLEDSKSIVLLAEPVSDRFKALESQNRMLLEALEAISYGNVMAGRDEWTLADVLCRIRGIANAAIAATGSPA